jgi:hypothetical protein
MKFRLEIEMDESDGSILADYGIDNILPEYLRQVADKCESGRADAGLVIDVNGNTIGKYQTTDGE